MTEDKILKYEKELGRDKIEEICRDVIENDLYGLYVIYDTVAEDRGPIFEAKTVGVALRQFYELISKSTTPNDFELIRIGWAGKQGKFQLIEGYEKIETENIIEEVK